MLASGKALSRTGRISICIKGSLDGGAALFHFFIGLAVGCIFYKNCQTSWSRINGDFVEGNTAFFKFCIGKGTELIHHAGHDVGRHFFGTDFQKKILAHFPSLPFSMGNPSSLRFFSHALAQALARFLTRPMYSVRSEREMAPAASSRLKLWEHFST